MTAKIDDYELTSFVQDQIRLLFIMELKPQLDAIETRMCNLEKDMNTLKSVFSFVFDDAKPEQ